MRPRLFVQRRAARWRSESLRSRSASSAGNGAWPGRSWCRTAARSRRSTGWPDARRPAPPARTVSALRQSRSVTERGPGRGRDHARMVGIVLVGDVGVETEARVDAVASIHLAGYAAALARTEELPIGTGGGPVTPDSRYRQGVVASIIRANAAL